ncbi:MAG: carboxynorspermidine decarboxylase [Arenicella sp.]
MNSQTFFKFDATRVPSPCFVIDEAVIEQNLKVLHTVQQESGAKVLLALKAFSMFALAPVIMKYLSGCCASGLHEALLAHEYFGGREYGADKREVHVYSPAYSEAEIHRLCDFADHLVFNSFSQWQRFQAKVLLRQQQRPELRCGLRINPMLSLGEVEMYDPCAAGSRLGINADVFRQYTQGVSAAGKAETLQGISGLHFHTLCEQGVVPLLETLDAIEQQFADILPQMQWLNLGGGHHITQADYDVAALIKKIRILQRKYQLQVYLEPGEAVAINSGVLVSEVLDLPYNQMDLAIVDTSATCHMPDTLEMPYRAGIFLQTTSDQQSVVAAHKGEKDYNYRLGGQTCLAGDVMGDYSFEHPLSVGQRLMFDDMAHYTMVKTSTFNGMPLPAIAIWNSATDQLRMVKQFDYADFQSRLS